MDFISFVEIAMGGLLIVLVYVKFINPMLITKSQYKIVIAPKKPSDVIWDKSGEVLSIRSVKRLGDDGDLAFEVVSPNLGLHTRHYNLNSLHLISKYQAIGTNEATIWATTDLVEQILLGGHYKNSDIIQSFIQSYIATHTENTRLKEVNSIFVGEMDDRVMQLIDNSIKIEKSRTELPNKPQNVSVGVKTT